MLFCYVCVCACILLAFLTCNTIQCMESCVCFFIKGAVIVSHSNCSFSTIVKDFVGRPGLEFPVV